MRALLLQTVPVVLAWCWYIALACDLLMLPLALWRKARPAVGLMVHISSWVFGAALWYTSALLTFALWGVLALLAGVLLLGVGVVPMGLIATAWHALRVSASFWAAFELQAFLLALTFASRRVGWLLLGAEGRQAFLRGYYRA